MTDAICPAAKAAVLRKGAARKAIEIEVIGPSMGAAIPSGARVIVVAASRPRRGEVWALVGDESKVVVHRFRRERGGLLWFQGDGNARVDRPVEPDMLIGRVESVECAGRRKRIGAIARLRGRVVLDATSLARRVRSLRCRPG